MSDPLRAFKGLKYFKPTEFTNPERMDPALLRKLDRARDICGFPFVITSSVRSWPPGSSHITGTAVDVALGSPQMAYAAMKACLLVGMPRIILYTSHVHLSTDLSKSHPYLAVGGKSK